MESLKMSLHEVILACFALCMIVGAIISLKPLLARLTPHKGRSVSPDKSLVLEAHLSLDRTRRLSLVRCGQKEVLVLSGGATDVLLEWSSARAFAALLEDAP